MNAAELVRLFAAADRSLTDLQRDDSPLFDAVAALAREREAALAAGSSSALGGATMPSPMADLARPLRELDFLRGPLRLAAVREVARLARLDDGAADRVAEAAQSVDDLDEPTFAVLAPALGEAELARLRLAAGAYDLVGRDSGLAAKILRIAPRSLRELALRPAELRSELRDVAPEPFDAIERSVGLLFPSAALAARLPVRARDRR